MAVSKSSVLGQRSSGLQPLDLNLFSAKDVLGRLFGYFYAAIAKAKPLALSTSACRKTGPVVLLFCGFIDSLQASNSRSPHRGQQFLARNFELVLKDVIAPENQE